MYVTASVKDCPGSVFQRFANPHGKRSLTCT